MVEDYDLQEEVKEVKKLVEENHKILKSMQRHARMTTAVRFLYWMIIIGIGIGAFYYLQPYIDQANEMYKKIQKTSSDISDVQNTVKENLQKYFVK